MDPDHCLWETLLNKFVLVQGMDVQEMRRIREEEGIQLRKQKREQQLFKRRNVGTENVQV